MERNPVPTEALPALAQPATGAVLDARYRLIERIGRGGMADVYAAEDELLHRRVALKVFRFDLCTPEELRRVHAEMQTLAALHHPGLVTIYDAGAVHEMLAADALSSPYLVMELVKGPNLGRRLAADGALTPGEAAQLGFQLSNTLAYVHSRNVVHRDVKPANILLDSTVDEAAPFVTKLTDFGIARVVDSTHHTEVGFTIGTANYLSPEQALSSEVGTATDVYSLGLVLIESLTGQVAFPGSGVEAALARLHRPPTVPAQFGQAWYRLLTAATESAPEYRPTAAELADQLAELAGGALTGPVLLPVPGSAPRSAAGAPAQRPAAGLAERTETWVPDFVLAGAAGAAAGASDAAGSPDAGGRVGEDTSGLGGLFGDPGTEPIATGLGLAANSRIAAHRATGHQAGGHRVGGRRAAGGPVTGGLAGGRSRRPRRAGLVAAAMLAAAVLLTSGFLVRSGHSGGNTPAPTRAALQSPATSRASAASASSVASRSASASTTVPAAQPVVVSSSVKPPVAKAPAPTPPAPKPPAPHGPGKPGHGKKGKH